MKDVNTLYALAKKRVVYAEGRDQVDTKFANYYLQAVRDEILEVVPEIKDHNAVHLEDELSDVLWNYLNLVATLESLGLVRSADHIALHGVEKFSERFRAVEEGSSEVWDEIKTKQKERLALMHEKYLQENDRHED